MSYSLRCDPSEDVVVAVFLNSSKLQKYKRKLLGYFPDGKSEDSSGWKLTRTLGDKDFHDFTVESIFKIFSLLEDIVFSL